MVAPVRERGLKCMSLMGTMNTLSRSREGAWIEIYDSLVAPTSYAGRSREGAWIEIF